MINVHFRMPTAMSRAAANAFSRGRQPTENVDTTHEKPRSGDTTLVSPLRG
jgi:hypothetical protein